MNHETRIKRAVNILGICLLLAVTATAQFSPSGNPSTTPIQLYPGLYPLTPITATTAVGSATTLTLPAPINPTFYNYVCSLAISASNNNTGAVLTNVVTSATNFNSFALKFSAISANSNSYDWGMKIGDPATGCAKSTSPGTATTFVSPTSTNEAYTWIGSFFQAP